MIQEDQGMTQSREDQERIKDMVYHHFFLMHFLPSTIQALPMSQCPCRSNVNIHPGQIIIDAKIHRHTLDQKKADNQALQQAKDAQLAAVQKMYEQIGTLEDMMAKNQWSATADPENSIKPLRSRPQVVSRVLGTG